MKRKIQISVGALVALLVVWFSFKWTVNRVYIEPGQSLMLRYKGPLIFGSGKSARAGYWAEEGEVGVLAKLRGPGRHFYCPLWYERTTVPDVVIKPGEVGLVTCKLGDDLPAGQFLVDGDIGDTKHKGILRKVLHPGRYRINPYGYEVQVVQRQVIDSGSTKKHAGWVEIPTGYVGVVTNLADNPLTGAKAGISDNVLPPGIYPINAREQNIDIVEIGFRHTTILVAVEKDKEGHVVTDENGEPKIANAKSGIQFPSEDGFPMQLDYTAIWGLMPEQAPHAIKAFGDVDMIEQKIVLPQIESIMGTRGSKYKATALLVGNSREKYQSDATAEFHDVLAGKGITLLYGLVRYVHIPAEVRKPIQLSFIADELALTRAAQQETAKEEAKFRESEEQVKLASKTVEVETTKLVAERIAQGNREAQGIEAETQRLVAKIAKETAEAQAEAERLLGEATAKGKQMQEEAKAARFELAVKAFGSAEAYNKYIFASSLPDDVKLNLMYAGPGTLWTDMQKGNGSINVMVPVTQEPKK